MVLPAVQYLQEPQVSSMKENMHPDAPEVLLLKIQETCRTFVYLAQIYPSYVDFLTQIYPFRQI